MNIRLWSCFALLAGGVMAVLAGSKPAPHPITPANDPAPTVRYGRDVRPILSDRCFICHGPDPATRAAGLRLDSFEEATAARRNDPPVLVPGDPDASEMWARMTSHDLDEVMPPPEANKRPLSTDELASIRQWILEGAQYEPHWAFETPTRPDIPDATDADWGQNEIDGFILEGLHAAGLEPSDPTDPQSLLRRVFLDLTGLPPTPDEVAAYIADDRPDRYERWVDRLLTEEPYRTRHAEHMTVPWLDQARYADTSGIHMDNGRSIWPWRDWVLRAYRDNMPFDQFVIEQLAGDLIEDATLQQKIASGFNRNHITTDEGGVIAEEYLVEYAVDRVSTTGSVFMGLTFACARCHDHKYDPVSMDDFYSLMAFFNSIEEPGLYSQTQDTQRAYEPFIAAPSPEQAAQLDDMHSALAQLVADRDAPDESEDAEREAFLTGLADRHAIDWVTPAPLSAESTDGATLEVLDDHSVRAGGDNPNQDQHVITIETDATDLRLIALEALLDPSFPEGRVGRAPNGNAVLGAIEVQAISIADPSRTADVTMMWAWADVEQDNGDYHVENALDPDPSRGWAVGAHTDPQGAPRGRVALFLADQPFGFEGGTRLRVRLDYRTPYNQHTLGRVRLSLSPIDETTLADLPVANAGFYRMGHFAADAGGDTFDQAFGPELSAAFDRTATIDDKAWRFDLNITEGTPYRLSDVVGAEYLAREMFAPSARTLTLSLGSDDAIRLFVNSEEAFSNRVARGVAPDQDSAEIRLEPGRNTLIYKIVNTGGPSGIYTRTLPEETTLPHPIVAMLLPEGAQRADLASAADAAWRFRFSPHYREMSALVAEQEARIAALQAQIPNTMVMKERETPRDTYVLDRGMYDHPITDRKRQRAVPVVFGSLAQDASPDRLGLAEWLVSEENPLLARVTVNRYWAMFFGEGIVRTLEDFGLQGEWPSHPELLDWLAVEFRESGWDVTHMVRLIVTSDTYRQSARRRADAFAIDADNRLLAYFPRQRLGAEQIRDQALYVGGLLVEQMGGPSVKPYQPEGLWREVAMPQSNTSMFERDDGDALWRRSMYTYWKRASPPPSMLTLDAPTREFCNIRRITTNTPLQALVLWNDEQFVEAARAAAARVLAQPGDDDDRLEWMYTLCTGQPLDARRRDAIARGLDAMRTRFRASEDDARALLATGEAPLPEDIDVAELAAWTMLANTVLSSDAAIVKD